MIEARSPSHGTASVSRPGPYRFGLGFCGRHADPVTLCDLQPLPRSSRSAICRPHLPVTCASPSFAGIEAPSGVGVLIAEALLLCWVSPGFSVGLFSVVPLPIEPGMLLGSAPPALLFMPPICAATGETRVKTARMV